MNKENITQKKIVARQSKWFSFLFTFNYSTEIVEFCRSLKRKYGYDMINFVKEKDHNNEEMIGWGFSEKKIYEEIVAKYPDIEVETTKGMLDSGACKPVNKEPIDTVSSKLETNTKLELYPFQKQAVNFITQAKGTCLIADEMGLGKTVIAITYAHINDFKTLVICPASMKLLWRDEIHKFTDRKATVLFANKMKKDINLDKYDFVIMNYEIVKKAITIGIDFRPFDLIVCDESTYIKSPKAQRTKAVKRLHYIKHKVALTGTPVINRPAELWSQLNFIDPSIYRNQWKFYMRYCDAKRTSFGWDFSGHSHLDELRENLQGVIIRRLKKDVLQELPDKTETLIKITLPTNKWADYNKLYDELTSILDAPKSAIQLTRLTYLKQFLALSKLESLVEMLKNFLDTEEKIVLFSQYLEPLHYLKEKFGDIAVVYEGKMKEQEREKAIKSFQNDKNTQIFLGSIMASGMGLTLTSANKAVFIDLPWQPSIITQASDRLHRIGQKDIVNIYYLVTEDTIEEQIYELLNSKMSVISKLLNEKKMMKVENESILPELIDKIKKANP